MNDIDYINEEQNARLTSFEEWWAGTQEEMEEGK